MRKLIFTAAFAAATAISAPAMAGSSDGKWQVKVLGTAVLPDGGIRSVKAADPATTLGAAAVALNPYTEANDNYVPTLAIEYFFNDNISVETICCFTEHHVNATDPAALDGARLVRHVRILPATLTVKYHLAAGAIKPYVGAGPAVFFVFGEKPGADAAALGISRVKMSNQLGFALQAGVDVPLGASGFGVSLDAKKYFMRPTASFYEGSVLALKTKHELDPWVLSGGVSYRF